MKKDEFIAAENYMKKCMNDSAHDTEHVYRVLYTALYIASTMASQMVDLDILTYASLLHDIGRKKQFDNPQICHADAGSEMAYSFLITSGKDIVFAEHVRNCIRTHRFRSNDRPTTLEAKILFDADKLEACGSLGIARTLLYKGKVGEPIYTLSDSKIDLGLDSSSPESFFKEFNQKLKKIYSGFYTTEAKRIAAVRKSAAMNFFQSLENEIFETIDYRRYLEDTLC